MNTMVDSITTLQNQMTALLPQMALLTEDPDAYLARTGANAVPGDPGGPAVRERVWAYAQYRDRNKARALEEQMAKVIKGLVANEYAVALLNQESTDGRNNVEAIAASLTSLRSERVSPPTSTGGEGGSSPESAGSIS